MSNDPQLLPPVGVGSKSAPLTSMETHNCKLSMQNVQDWGDTLAQQRHMTTFQGRKLEGGRSRALSVPPVLILAFPMECLQTFLSPKEPQSLS